jgi:hypothetical protein
VRTCTDRLVTIYYIGQQIKNYMSLYLSTYGTLENYVNVKRSYACHGGICLNFVEVNGWLYAPAALPAKEIVYCTQ